MTVPSSRRAFVLGALALGLPVRAIAQGGPGGLPESLGLRFGAQPNDNQLRRRRRRGAGVRERLHHWNAIAVDASGLDHTPVAAGRHSRLRRAGRPRARQPGDGDRAHRDLRRGERDRRRLPELHRASRRAARDLAGRRDRAGRARHAWSRSSRRRRAPSTTSSPRTSRTVPDGRAQGRRGRARTARRRMRSSRCARTTAPQHAEPRVGIDFIPSDGPGKWRQDPISLHPLALGAHWGEVDALRARDRRDQFRVPPPPALESSRIRGRIQRGEVARRRRRHHARRCAPTTRPSPASTGPTTARRASARRRGSTTRSRCRSPSQMRPAPVELARLLAPRQRGHGRRRHRDLGVEVPLRVLAAGHRHPRGRPGHRANGAGDGTAHGSATVLRRSARPPATSIGPNFTPPFPAYPSGHAGFGGALFQILRRFYGTDRIPFTFVSDEFNGVTLDNEGHVRPLMPRSFSSLSRGRGGERPEPHLSRDPLGLRQDRGHRPGPAGGGLRLPQRVRAPLAWVASGRPGWVEAAAKHRNQGKITAANRDLAHLEAVAPKQAPFAAFLSCADSRVPVEIIFDQGFGDVFVVRVADDVAAAEETASLEFGTLMLGAKVLGGAGAQRLRRREGGTSGKVTMMEV